MYSIKNAVYVAIMQVGVIVFGVLGAGICVKLQRGSGLQLPLPTLFLVTHAFNLFVIPLVWIICLSVLNLRPMVSDRAKTLALFSGVLVLMGLVVFVVYADLRPFLATTYNLSGDGER